MGGDGADTQVPLGAYAANALWLPNQHTAQVVDVSKDGEARLPETLSELMKAKLNNRLYVEETSHHFGMLHCILAQAMHALLERRNILVRILFRLRCFAKTCLTLFAIAGMQSFHATRRWQ